MSTRRRAAVWALFTLAGALFVTTLILFGVAIWTVGDDSGRWGGTAVLALVLCAASCIAASFALPPTGNH